MYDNFGFYEGFFKTSRGGKKLEGLFALKKGNAWRIWFYSLLDKALGRFVYTLPDTCDARYLELSIINSAGAVCNVKDKPMTLRPLITGQFNPYGRPDKFQAIDYMGRDYGVYIPDFPMNKGFADAVLFQDTPTNLPPIYRIGWYADRLTDIEAQINNAIANCKASVILYVPEEQKKDVERMYTSPSPIIMTYDTKMAGLGDNKPEIMAASGVVDVLKALYEIRDKTLADFAAEFGVQSNGVINKMSGVSAVELEQNEQQISVVLNSALNERKLAIEKCREMFPGYEWDVKLAFDLNGDYNVDEDTEEVVDESDGKEDNDVLVL